MRTAILASLLALSFALLTGCDIPEPLNTETGAPLGIDEAVEMARGEWEKRLGPLPAAPPIRWFEGDCLRYAGDPPEPCVGGTTWIGPFWDTEIHGLIDHADLIVAHELLHWALDEAGQDADGDHSGPLWADVPKIKAMLEI